MIEYWISKCFYLEVKIGFEIVVLNNVKLQLLLLLLLLLLLVVVFNKIAEHCLVDFLCARNAARQCDS